MPHIHKITVYPIKSLDGTDVTQAKITENGSLFLDRAFLLKNADGRTVNAKKYPSLQKVRAYYDLEAQKVKLKVNGQEAHFQLMEENERLARFFSDYLGEQVRMETDFSAGFPDDDQNSGPTIVSTRTFEELQAWFPGLSLDNLRQRFRANIELGGCQEPFWEDRLFDHPGVNRRFRLATVKVIGKQPCARCPVPTRNPLSGVGNQDFMREFIAKRRDTLPSFASEAQFDHFYRLCVNTIIPSSEAGKVITLEDTLSENN